jgi:GNAT superfamily N-acetyltransferase
VTHAIRRIELPLPGIEELRREALAESYNFVETLVEECRSGANRYDRAGETLLGCFDGAVLVAVGGLNIDPFANDPTVGRLRRVYVRPAWRSRGVGRELVMTLVKTAREHFRRVRLRAETAGAARLYERLGFAATADPDATHEMELKA